MGYGRWTRFQILVLSLTGWVTVYSFPRDAIIKYRKLGTSLVIQGLRICLAMQGTWVPSLVREPSSHLLQSYWAHATQLVCAPWWKMPHDTAKILCAAKRLLLLFGHSVVSNSLWPHGLQHARLPVLHHLSKLSQTHVHWVSDAIQPSHPLSPPSPPALNLYKEIFL